MRFCSIKIDGLVKHLDERYDEHGMRYQTTSTVSTYPETKTESAVHSGSST